MMMPQRATISCFCRTIFVDTPIFALIGAPVAVVVATQHGLPTHAMITFLVMIFELGWASRSAFIGCSPTILCDVSRPIEWVLMILGCMGGQNSPFYWIAYHRTHHRHSDHDGDPHSPHIWAGRRFQLLHGFWHSYFGWLHANGSDYPKAAVRDLARRPDLAWIDRHWFQLYLTGPRHSALVGFAIGGTGYDALVGLLWGGLFGSFLGCRRLLRSTPSVTVGSRPDATADHSRRVSSSGSPPSAMVGTTITTPSRRPHGMGFTGGSRTSRGA